MRTADRKTWCAVLPLVVILGIAPTVSAQSSRWDRESRRSEMEMRSRDLRSLENYLDEHWRVAQRLYEEPDLINDRQFVRNNASLDEWLDAHPDAAEALRDNPHRYLWHDRTARADDANRYDRAGTGRMTERELRSFETFLDRNPETAQRLYEDPDLLTDRQFVRSRDGLSDWLERNPKAAQALRDNPHRYLWRERNVTVTDFLSQLLQPSPSTPSER